MSIVVFVTVLDKIIAVCLPVYWGSGIYLIATNFKKKISPKECSNHD